MRLDFKGGFRRWAVWATPLLLLMLTGCHAKTTPPPPPPQTAEPIVVSWTGDSTCASAVCTFQVYRSAAGGAFVQVTQQLASPYTDTNVDVGVTYSYYVTETGPAGTSPVSVTVTGQGIAQ